MYRLPYLKRSHRCLLVHRELVKKWKRQRRSANVTKVFEQSVFNEATQCIHWNCHKKLNGTLCSTYGVTCMSQLAWQLIEWQTHSCTEQLLWPLHMHWRALHYNYSTKPSKFHIPAMQSSLCGKTTPTHNHKLFIYPTYGQMTRGSLPQ